MECFEAMQRDRRPEALGDLRVLPDELICAILESLSPRDVARLTCVSSVFYILCNEEPLWMTLCLKSACGQLEYKGSWKRTTLHRLDVPDKFLEACTKHLQFDGFNSLFLYKRFYRCFTSLDTFSLDKFVVKREKDPTLEDFQKNYDGQKPVLLTGLAETWPARNKWTIDQLSYNYGDFMFKISQRSSKKITMNLKDYVSYMKQQHDEDPLYVFDDKFGEVAPDLLKDYTVPLIFREDFFDALDRDQRPPFRWLIIGPERSGASWHVDPALTSAWNTLLCGRKRWALYPPGRVPLGVTVHVNEEDGDVNVETPSSLQWWLDIYPLLADEDKPIECTQLPGETIFVPSGWWHCVLNLETTVAVTQNFVNSKNFEFACLDMTPGYRHKGVCRAGLLAMDSGSLRHANRSTLYDNSQLNDADMERKEKRLRVSSSGKDLHMCVDNENPANVALKDCYLQTLEFSYDIEFLSTFLEEDRDHYNAEWSPSNSIGQREMRMWLHKLWVEKPGIRELIWKGACLALNAEKWSARMKHICASHNLPSPSDDEKLPVGTGSNPVYLTADCVIKIYVEGGIESSIHGLGTELEFYGLLQKVDSPLRDHVPDVLASGIIFQENGSIRNVPWDGKGIPYVIANCNLTGEKNNADGFPFGVWSKKQFECRKAAVPVNQPTNSIGGINIWPYIITKRCKGHIFAELRDILSWDDAQNLASFLGEQLHNLHTLPLPPFHTYISELNISNPKMPSLKACLGALTGGSTIPLEWQLFVETMTRRKKDISSRLEKWGDPIPRYLIDKVEEYVPDDLSVLLNTSQDEKGLVKVHKSCCWVHSDIMDDNIYMEPCSVSSFPDDDAPYASMLASGSLNGCKGSGGQKKWHPSYILDFSDLSMGDPICDLIPIHLDVFRGDPKLLKKFLESYKLPLMRRLSSELGPVKYGNKFERLSYHAMCYCILHDDNVLGSIFSLWPELRTSKSWEEVEETVWGELNNYEGFC